MANVLFRVGTRAQYDALAARDANTLYWLTDTQELRKGEFLYGTGKAATAAADGLLSAEDKAKLDAMVDSGVAGLHAADASLIIGGDENGMTVGARLSAVEGNSLVLKGDGLYVPTAEVAQVPEYAIEKMGEAEDGYSATYKLKRTLNGESTYVGDEINIPKDLVIESGELKTVEAADVPYAGAEVGDPYLDIVLNDADASHIYIPVKGLVDIYTAGDGITIVNNAISVTNRTIEVLNGPNGMARIWNESDGGGVQFTHSDGTRSFTGVNDGGKGGITGQLYSVDTKNGNLGTRLNMTNDGFFYFKGKTSATAYTADDEIATRGDIESAKLTWEDM